MYAIFSILILVCCAVIDATSGNFGRTAIVFIVLLIVCGIIAGKTSRESREVKERVDRLRQYYPEKSDAYLRSRVECGYDIGDLGTALYRRQEAELRRRYPGKPDAWYMIEMQKMNNERDA